MLSDLKYSTRQLIKAPGFTATVLATFALCIGANALIFSVIHAVLLKPLPFPNPEQLVVTVNSYPKAGIEHFGSSGPNYFERKAGIPAFADVAALRPTVVTIGDAGGAERAFPFRVTPSFFHVLGVSAARGRLFLDEEGRVGRDTQIVLSDGFWRQQFNADPAVVGRTLRIDGVPFAIVGVLPARFSYFGQNVPFWEPLAFTDRERSINDRHNNKFTVIARLKPGASIEEAQSEIDALNARQLKIDPGAKFASDAGYRTRVLGLHQDYVAQVRPALVLLQAGALFLLLIGAVNLINLFMIRGSARAKDQALRQALGASRMRLIGLALSETSLLALAGWLLGLGLAANGLRLLAVLGTQNLPLGADVTLDAPVILASLAGSAVMAAVLTLPAAVMSFRRHLAPVLSAESRSGTASRATHHLRHSLIVVQVALAFVLLAGTGLLGLSFRRVLASRPGFQPENVLTGRIVLPSAVYGTDPQRLAVAERLLEAVGSAPGMIADGLITAVPVTGSNTINITATWVEGRPPPEGTSLQSHYVYFVAGNYFEAMGLPLRAGRLLTASDSRRKERVCVVDDIFARHYWPQGSALGHRLSLSGPKGTYYSIAGVVGSVKQNDLAETAGNGAIYVPFLPDNSPSVFIAAVRTAQAPTAAASALSRAVLSVDPGLAIDDVKTMNRRIEDSLTTRRSTMILAVVFSGMALVLAAVGVYGVLAYAVVQRQREIGVRMALGALPKQILGKFLSLGCRLLVLGALIGLIGAWFVGRAMSSLLFGVTPFDPLVVAGTGVVLGLVVIVASLLPSLKAARLSPLDALRSD